MTEEFQQGFQWIWILQSYGKKLPHLHITYNLSRNCLFERINRSPWSDTHWADTLPPPLGRHTAPSRHSHWADTPPLLGRHRPWADTSLLVRHPPPPCTVHTEIRSTSGRNASHWNAFLFFTVNMLLFNLKIEHLPVQLIPYIFSKKMGHLYLFTQKSYWGVLE